MQKLTFTQTIHAPRQLVWETMLAADTYRDWVRLFSPYGSWYEGDWSAGSRMKFLGKDDQGRLGGLVSQVLENRPHDHISINHLTDISEGVEDTTSHKQDYWRDSRENYTFTDVPTGTQVAVDLVIPDEFADYMRGTWPLALARLKVLCERPESITINATVGAPIAKVWEYWTMPEHITQWNQASPDWHCPAATNDLKSGGRLVYTMASKDGKYSFDLSGTYIKIDDQKYISYILDDGRRCETTFVSAGDTIQITTTFQMENENSRELQQAGWQAILDSFKQYTESK